jgi:hypothetical protein
MNRYILIRRLTGPSILLLLGVVALLHQADLVNWSIFVPLLLILIGVLNWLNVQRCRPGEDELYPGGQGPYQARRILRGRSDSPRVRLSSFLYARR